jgi:class 3 adenylate cyclase
VVFEDVVGSTVLASEIGDDAWGRLRVQRERLVRDCVEDHGGRVISTAGDGSMCTLPGPAVAIRCAEQLHDVVRPLELELRVGIHTGECERIGNELTRDSPAEGSARRLGAARCHQQHNRANRARTASQAATERSAHRHRGAPGTARRDRP